jgi:hypothetical protein
MGEPEWELPLVDDFAWSDATPASSQTPDVGGVYEPSHTEHYVHLGLDAVHVASTIAEIYEIFHVSGAPLAAAHGGLAGAAAVVAPLGGVAVVVVTAMELYKAFDTVNRIETQKGITYGIMWGVLGVPDVPHTTRPGPFGGDLQLTDHERASWQEGVDKGRELAKDPAVRQAIERSLAYEMALQKRDLATDPQHRAWNVAVQNTMNRVWDQVHEKQKGLDGSTLSWQGKEDGFPKPAPKP